PAPPRSPPGARPARDVVGRHAAPLYRDRRALVPPRRGGPETGRHPPSGLELPVARGPDRGAGPDRCGAAPPPPPSPPWPGPVLPAGGRRGRPPRRRDGVPRDGHALALGFGRPVVSAHPGTGEVAGRRGTRSRRLRHLPFGDGRPEPGSALRGQRRLRPPRG